ncbi:MAG TPA: hypothetical protein VFC46_10245 [Humisphaera sp.]|nr:hypothetical protein [Humisphaera sp.]
MNCRAYYVIAMGGLLVLLSGGCIQSPPTPDEISRGPLAFLQPGMVSEADLLLRFGAPTGRFEGDKTITWRLGRTADGIIGPASRVVTLIVTDDNSPKDWGGTLYDLVVVFDEHQMLKRYSLLAVCES